MEGIRDSGTCPTRRFWGLSVGTAAVLQLAFATASAQIVQGNAMPGENVDVIGPTPAGVWEACEPTMQQNEPDGVRSLVFPGHLAMGVNDYRCVNDRAIGEAWPGIATSTTFGKTWVSGLVPGHLKDDPNIGQKGGADPNLEIAPYILYYNYIAFWRDDSRPPGIYTARFYEPNREVGVPFRHFDTSEDVLGNSGQFNDKPSFELAFFDPDEGRPDIEFTIPAYTNPLNPADSHPAYVQKTPAHRLHLCYTKFVGNDNNNGTKVECQASDDGGRTYNIKNKLSESVEINQGTSIATRNGGRQVVVVWTRFREPQDKELGAVMYAMSNDYGNSFSKAKVITEFCPFNQSTGAARFRTNALPSIVSDGSRFSVYIAARNDATEACFVPGKGNRPDTILMSDVMLADDFDDYNEDRDDDGNRIKDGKVRTSNNFARIMRIEGTGSNSISWGVPQAIDPAEDVNEFGKTVRQRFHQFMVNCDAASGVETCTFTDNRLDKYNTLLRNLPARPFVEDMVLHLEPGDGGDNAKVVPTLLPAGAYEGVPDPSKLPPNRNNLPLRSTLEQFVFQVKDGNVRPYTVNSGTYHVTDSSDPQAISSPSVRITRFATRQKPGAPAGTEQQVEWDYANPRAFQKGKASFNGDYSALFGESARQRESDLKWESNQDAPNPATDIFSSLESEFHAGWTSNHKIRGKVWYTGCDTWNEDLQMWEAGAGCDSPYTQVDGKLLPLQGEDGTSDGAPLTCSAAVALGRARAPLTRDQTVMTAALTPGISAFIVSAIKPADGGQSTFVMQVRNGTSVDKMVNISIPAGVGLSFGADAADSLLSIPLLVPAYSGNVRTIFDYGDLDETPGLPTTMVAEVTDPDNGNAKFARVALNRESLNTPPLGNVQSNPDAENPTTVDLLLNEYYDLALQREFALDPTRAVLSLESFDLENTPELFELENLDFATFDLENKLVFFELENFELENFELENTDLRNDLYQAFDLENILVNYAGDGDNEEQLLFFDLENFELENFELENFDLENFELENFELENFELENFELENFELENETAKASSMKNFELENFELENAAPGDSYTEVSWRADSLSNTTTGVDVAPIFTPQLAEQLAGSGATVLLTVRQAYLNPTVGFAGAVNSCSAEIVVNNQILYVKELNADEILAAQFTGSINDPDPTNPLTAGFPVLPDGNIVVSLRVINPTVSAEELSAGSGIGLFAQAGDVLNCDLELPGDEANDLCEVDFVEPDIEPPVITLNGSSPTSVDQGATYVDAGATALDNVDGDITDQISVSGWDFDTSVAGSFVIYYDVSDEAENDAVTVTRTINVIDTEDPVVSILGDDPMTVEAGSTFVDPGAGATDNVGVIGSVTSDASTSVNTSVVGMYTVTYTATDAEGNTGTATRTVNVVDTTPPVITLIGASTLTLEAGEPYIEQGANVIDSGDPSVTVSITGVVNSAVVGSYPVTYDATDASSNMAIQVVRTVNVIDTSVPVIDPLTSPDFTPPEPFVLNPGETTFTAAWPVNAMDPNPMLMASCIVTNPDDSETMIAPIATSSVAGEVEFTFSYPFGLGTSNVTCTAVDQGGNSASGSFQVLVEDYPVVDESTLPIMPFYVEANDPSGYVGQTSSLWSPVTASDGIDGTIAAVCTPENDLGFGDNTITCVATDSAGNMSAQAQFTATVVDSTPPDISAIENPFVISTIDTSADVSADELKVNVTATDSVDGTIDVANIICTIDGGANATLPLGIHAGAGSCTATDSNGNASGAVAFDVEIRFEYDFTLLIPNGNKRAGSVIPLDWYYTIPGTNNRVDSSGLAIEVRWFGPFTQRNCGGTNTGSGDGTDANDAGNSKFRWTASSSIWQYSWKTPDIKGSYELVVSPPGTEQSTACFDLK